MGTVALDGRRSTPTPAGIAPFLRTCGKDRSAVEGRGGRTAGQSRGGGCGGRSRRDVDPRGTGAARGALAENRRGAGEDRGARQERYKRELAEHEAKLAARAAKTAATGKKPGGKPPEPPTEGPLPKDQINLTDEESRIMPVGRRRLRAMLQCAGRGGRGQHAGGDGGRGSGAQRQAADRADAGQARGLAGGAGRDRNAARGRRLFQRDERRSLREGGGGAGDRDGPPAAPSASGRTLRQDAGGAGRSDAGRRRWRIG